jgi:predicted AAA+ superfamily ATPase
VLVGPRRVGKTTLARSFVPAGSPAFFDLEDPRVEAQFQAPLLTLEPLRGLVVIDEVQRAPELFKVLRVLMDRDPPPAMRRFWTMLAHSNGQVWNAAEPARSLGVNESTVRRHLDWLTQTFMVRQLQPWFENLGKRQVKSPKIYFRDTGLLHALLGIADAAALAAHPKSGASWEAFALERCCRSPGRTKRGSGRPTPVPRSTC